MSAAPKVCAAAVVLSGGGGSRFGNAGGKQLFEIGGRPIMTWSVQALDAVPEIGLIVVVCPPERRAEYEQVAIAPFNFSTPIVFADAGEIRQESSINGLDEIDASFDYVVFHDGARPLITPELVQHALNELRGNIEADGVVVGHPSIDTLKVVDEDGRYIVGTPERRMFWVAQTPQIFRLGFCRRAFSSAMFEGFVGTDDSSLVERMNGNVMMVNGPRDNLKMTVPEDAAMIEAALAARLTERGE